MMILYFSGTGNSEYAAQQIAAKTDDECLNLFTKIRSQDTRELTSQKPWVIVAPTYAWRIPRVVEGYLRKTKLNGSKKVYFVLTCGGDVGMAGKYAKKLCVRKGLAYQGLMGIRMPENYITMYQAPGREEIQEIIRRAKEPILLAASLVGGGRKFPEQGPTVANALKSGIVNDLFYPLFVTARGYHTTSACVGCGKCASLCPLNNIRMEGKQPVWGSECTQCMACICGCPVTAVEYRKKTQGKERYYLEG